MFVSFRCFRTGYIVPGLGFFPRLFSNSAVISAPVIGCLFTSHSMRKERYPLETQSIIVSHFGLSILKVAE